MIIFFRYFSIYSMEEIIIFSIKIIFINDLCSKPNFYNKWSSSLSIGENLAFTEGERESSAEERGHRTLWLK